MKHIIIKILLSLIFTQNPHYVTETRLQYQYLNLLELGYIKYDINIKWTWYFIEKIFIITEWTLITNKIMNKNLQDFNCFCVTDFDYYYDLIRSHKKDYIDTGAAAKEFLSINIKEKFKVFQKYVAAADDARTMLSERTQDPGWFEGRFNIYIF